jgi:hypothetical protein
LVVVKNFLIIFNLDANGGAITSMNR